MNFGFRISDFGLQSRHKPAVNGWVTPQSAIRNPQSAIAFRGFTLVELLVVIAIIALLLGLGLLVGPAVIG
ncbi:MAG: prepilin-type N-terminal cleavage/methylation domain-containing protein, partial [Phycisphaeraceae bacterium]